MREFIAAILTAAVLAMPSGAVPVQQSVDTSVQVWLLEQGEILKLNLREYLIRVVLQEMPASFEEEALKAQAVAARTFTLQQIYTGNRHEGADLCGESTCCQCYMDEQEAQEAYGDSYGEALERVRRAVAETDGQVMTFEGGLIEAAYFSSTAGSTECAADVWGGEVAYLQAVDSPEEASDSEAVYTPEEFRALFPELVLDGLPETWFGTSQSTEGGAVAAVEIGGNTYSGTELRSRLGLRSAKFRITVQNGEIVFSVSGSGHGVGMSQHGANTMAQQGSDYREILTHYYSGAVLQECY